MDGDGYTHGVYDISKKLFKTRTRWPCLIASPPAESPFAKSPFAQGDDFTDEFTKKEEDLLDGLGSGEEKFEDEGDIG
jgi:hypothetical protein